MQLPATLTLAQAANTLGGLRAAVSSAPADVPFVVDASLLSAFDTSAIAVLLDGQRGAKARGLTLAIQHAPAKLAQLAALYGVAELLGLQDSVA